MTTQFTGGANLSGQDKLVHEAMMRNELENGYGAYELGDGKIGKSGYSFGPVQWDLSGNPDGKRIFTDIVTNARDASGNPILSSGIDALTTKVFSHGDISSDLARINQALSSSYGQAKINTEYVTYLKNDIAYLDKVIATMTDSADRAFLQTDAAKVFLEDYNNQLNLEWDGQLHRFLNGERVLVGVIEAADGTIIDPGTYVQKQGPLAMNDLLEFYFSTKQYKQHPGDLVRRFGNVADVVNYLPTSRLEADLIIDLYNNTVGPVSDRILASSRALFRENVAFVAANYRKRSVNRILPWSA